MNLQQQEVDCMQVFRVLFAVAFLVGCGTSEAEVATPKPAPLPERSYPSEPSDHQLSLDSPLTVVHNARIFPITSAPIENGFIVMHNGKITDIGPGEAPALEGAQYIDTKGAYVTPGIIDTHSHMGVYANPSVRAHSDGNEMVSPVTADIWSEHGFWPQDPSIRRALSGGVTTIQVLPGSANLIGGRSYIAKLKPGTSAREMRFPGAPQGLKIACGENPKRVYGSRGGPSTRMGNAAGFRKTFQRARAYQYDLEQYDRDLEEWRAKASKDAADAGDPPSLPSRDLKLETLVKVLKGEILIHNHCYRADDMHIMLDIAEEFGFKIRSFHHALEAYKLSDRLAKLEVASSTWADWWGFKMEAYDGIPHNAAMLSAAGAIAVIHSDSSTEIRRLNQETAKARRAGLDLGLKISETEALRWVTLNAAWALGIEKEVGSLEKGKHADVVIWDKHPLSVYSRPQHVFIDGSSYYDHSKPQRLSDFELGQPQVDHSLEGSHD